MVRTKLKAPRGLALEERSNQAFLARQTCRGIVTVDVLEQGLSLRAITLGSLKGLIGTKDTRGFILVRPLTMKVKAYV